MNKDNAHLYLPLVQALADGKVIQINGVRGWEDTRGDILFGAAPFDYRIKPEPREWWQVRCEDGTIIADHPDEAGAQEFAERRKQATLVRGSKYEVVRVREVLPT